MPDKIDSTKQSDYQNAFNQTSRLDETTRKPAHHKIAVSRGAEENLETQNIDALAHATASQTPPSGNTGYSLVNKVPFEKRKDLLEDALQIISQLQENIRDHKGKTIPK